MTMTIEQCPRGADKPEPSCTNRHQCWEPCGELGKSAAHVRVGRESAHLAAHPSNGAAVDMILYCPNCGAQHVDEPDERTPNWQNPAHRSHLCHGCGCIWRPADVPTNGVSELKTQGKADTWKVQPGAMSGAFPVSDLRATPPPAPEGDARDAARLDIDSLIDDLEYAVLCRAKGLPDSAENLSEAKQAVRAALSGGGK